MTLPGTLTASEVIEPRRFALNVSTYGPRPAVRVELHDEEDRLLLAYGLGDQPDPPPSRLPDKW